MLASDLLGPRRPLDDHRHKLSSFSPFKLLSLSVRGGAACRCKEEVYAMEGESVSVLIAYHNEALSVLVRMLNSILDQTPPDILTEFILLDDDSKDGPSRPHLALP